MQSPEILHKEGEIVIYGMMGKCKVMSIEERTIGNETITFYKLEPVKHWIGKPIKKETAIWVPIRSATDQGLRLPLHSSAIEEINQLLSNREYYFSLNESWHVVQPKLKAAIKMEGITGIAKAVSYLFVLKKRTPVPSSEMNKFSELCLKLLLREICDITQETSKIAEERILKMMRSKLQPDQ